MQVCTAFVAFVLAAITGLTAGIAMREVVRRRIGRAVAIIIASIVILLVVCLSTPDDPRRPSLLGPEVLCATAIAVLVMLFRPARWIVVGASVITVPLCLMQFVGMPFSMRAEEDEKVMSPDGQYRADLIYYDGLTYGYYFVAISPSNTWFGLEPEHEIAEADSEGFDNIAWKDDRTLVLKYDKGAGFAMREDRWRDVNMQYEPVSSR